MLNADFYTLICWEIFVMNLEVAVFVIYLLCMIGIGVYFFLKAKVGSDKSYFIGDRKMGPWVAALSAGASDMSAWVLMGMPTSIYALGLGQCWIPVGLAIGYTLSWIFEASRLRRFSIEAGDAITIPQYLTNRFLSKNLSLQVICAIVFMIAYTIYAASSIKACGTLFNTVIGWNPKFAMYVAALIIISYTFLGGFSAVCWTDFFQGMLMLVALLTVPIFASSLLSSGAAAASTEIPASYWDPFASWKDVVSGLAWGFGYFGMPHIIIRFMSIRSNKDLKKSAVIGVSWTLLIIIFATWVGIVGRVFLGYDETINTNSLVFVTMVRKIFPMLISGVLLSAVLSAAMSTADSQLLSAASAFASDVYKPIARKNKASDREMLWAARLVVLAVSVVAVLLASSPNSGSIMALVSNAWGVFGAAFGPAIMLSLYWKRFNFAGAVAGITVGAVVDMGWLAFFSSYGLYELFPGFVAGLWAAVVVTLCTPAPSAEVQALFDKAVNSDV